MSDAVAASTPAAARSFVGEGNEWKHPANPEYSDYNWDVTPDGGFQKRLATTSVMDTFSGFNYNKMNNRPGEYYAKQPIPLVDQEWDEEAYWNKWNPSKSGEEVAEELAAPVENLKEKLVEFQQAGEEICWTPALQQMTAAAKPARPLYFKLSPFFQTNTLGYRKNWANTALCELRPMQRMRLQTGHFFTDWFYRFHVMKFNVTYRPKLKYFKMMIAVSMACMFQDHVWAREYRSRNKFH